MFAAWNINEQQTYETGPTLPATPQQLTRKAMMAHYTLDAQIIEEWKLWKQIDTAIYWHLVPSLITQGVDQTSDLETINSYVCRANMHRDASSSAGRSLSL